MEKKIGFIGLGNMGINMAKNLISEGYHLQVHNRTISKADELNAASITRCNSPAEAARGVQAIITMLSEDDVVLDTVSGDDGILKTLDKNAVHISMSTISPDVSKLLSKLHTYAGNHYLAAPVFGRPDAAAAKKIWICISGNQQGKEIAKPILDLMGQGIIDFGEDAGGANVVKIAGNFMILSAMEMMSEAFTLGEKNGVERTKMAEFFTSTLFNAPIFQNYGKLIANKQYEPVGFKASLGYKDARLAFKLAQQSETPMPLGALVHNRMLTAIAKGRGNADWVEGISRGVSEDAGL